MLKSYTSSRSWFVPHSSLHDVSAPVRLDECLCAGRMRFTDRSRDPWQWRSCGRFSYILVDGRLDVVISFNGHIAQEGCGQVSQPHNRRSLPLQYENAARSSAYLTRLSQLRSLPISLGSHGGKCWTLPRLAPAVLNVSAKVKGKARRIGLPTSTEALSRNVDAGLRQSFF